MTTGSVSTFAKSMALFFREGVLRFHDTGALCATSRWAAKALTNKLRETRGPRHILELGPGTGSVTIQILADMIPGDKLTICEINPRFMENLKNRLYSNQAYQARSSDVSFFQGAAQELPEPETPFDIIVCALPFTNFSISTVRDIFERLHRVSHDETVMTYYEYIGLRKVSQLLSTPEKRSRLIEIDGFFNQKHRHDLIKQERIWLNFLPIEVHTLRVGSE
jgi:phospholipid N-methyltransferase